MNFSSGLLVFTAVLTPLCFGILVLSEKTIKVKCPRANSRGTSILIVCSFVLMGIRTLQVSLSLSAIWLTLVLYPLITSLLVLALWLAPDSKEKIILLAALTFHFIVLSRLLPTSGVRLAERSAALAKISQFELWNPEWGLLDAYYNQFPMDMGLQYAILKITSLSCLDALSGWAIKVFLTVAFDLVFYLLITRLTRSWRAGILGILLLAFTPPLRVGFTPQGLSSLLLLIFVMIFFETFTKMPTVPKIVIADLSFIAAILTHGTSAIGALLLLGLLGFSYFVHKIRKVEGERLYKNTLLVSSFFVLVVITLARWIHVAGIEVILNPFKSFVMDFLGYRTEWIGGQYVPLYDQLVSPLQAYAWSMPVSMALGCTLYYLTKRKALRQVKTVLILAMCITGGMSLFIGFLGGTVSGHSNLHRYLGYSSFVFFIPAATVVGVKTLKSSSVNILVLFLAAMVVFSGIGTTDPELSPELYEGMKTVDPAGLRDYLETRQLHELLVNGTFVVASYEILVSLDQIGVVHQKTIRPYVKSLKFHRALMEEVTEEKEMIPEVVYIWSSDIESFIINIPANVFYSSGEHLAFEQASARTQK